MRPWKPNVTRRRPQALSAGDGKRGIARTRQADREMGEYSGGHEAPGTGALGCFVVIASVSGVGAPAALALDRPPASQVQPRAFGSCASLVGYAKGHFASTHGWPEPPITGVATATSVGATHGTTSTGALATPSAAVAAGGSGGGTPSFSTTNDQEAGVDEPDIVKTNGSTIFTIANDTLEAVSVTGAAPQLAGTLNLGTNGENAQLLLDGNRAARDRDAVAARSRSSRCRRCRPRSSSRPTGTTARRR